MSIDRRSIGVGLFALGGVGALAQVASSAPAPGGSKVTTVGVHPGPDSVLEFDDRRVREVRDSLTAILLQNPSCLAGKIEDVLESEYPGAVTKNELPLDYVERWINGHWTHVCILLTQLEVDFGAQRTVLVEVEVTEPK